MKRTKEQAISFFKHRNTANRGKNRELYFTPTFIIEQIVNNLLVQYPELKNKIWIDPCAADGRWEQVISKFGITCYSFDLHPLNSTVQQKDFLNDNYDFNNIFFIGNPPFSLLRNFVDRALTITDSCYFLGGSCIITGTLSNKAKMIHRFEGFEGKQKDKRSKILFTDTNNDNVFVWCCGALFDKQNHSSLICAKEQEQNSFRVAIKKYCIEDTTRIITIKK